MIISHPHRGHQARSLGRRCTARWDPGVGARGLVEKPKSSISTACHDVGCGRLLVAGRFLLAESSRRPPVAWKAPLGDFTKHGNVVIQYPPTSQVCSRGTPVYPPE